MLIPPLSIITDSENITPHVNHGTGPSPNPKNKKYKKMLNTPSHFGHSTLSVISYIAKLITIPKDEKAHIYRTPTTSMIKEHINDDIQPIKFINAD